VLEGEGEGRLRQGKRAETTVRRGSGAADVSGEVYGQHAGLRIAHAFGAWTMNDRAA
jgi:hypothetical protein